MAEDEARRLGDRDLPNDPEQTLDGAEDLLARELGATVAGRYQRTEAGEWLDRETGQVHAELPTPAPPREG